MIHATKKQLTKAFEAHENLAFKGDTLSHKLLLFYCAECAIKVYYLKTNDLVNTEKIEPRMFKDLNFLSWH